MQSDLTHSFATTDEASLRYPGARVVATCFVMAVFCWGFGFYGQGVYLAELTRLHHWPASLISSAATVYYLVGAVLVMFVGDALARFGPRRVVLAGVACLGLSAVLVGQVTAPWQLYADYLLMAVGWATMSVAAISTIAGMWYTQRRGLAISLSLTGASFGGILGTPALVFAIGRVGFAATLAIAVAVMAIVLVPMVWAWLGRPHEGMRPRNAEDGAATSGRTWTRARALRSFAFWTVSAPFSLALLAQAGFLVHEIAYLEPRIGRDEAGVAVSLTTIMAVAGRVVLGFVVDRLDQRIVSALCLASQAAALLVLTRTQEPAVLLLCCAIFGLSVGNIITLPALVIQREFDASGFALLVGFSTAITQFTYSFGPGLLGLVRDATGRYETAILLCPLLEILAAVLVLAGRLPIGDAARR